ncbi:MAG: Fic family protein [Prosthecobacter sp.]|uniref:Fic family protein n=1 Tax=Prosthecobacter sp. TaxID=1965333 RepID=UPI0038FDEDC1
MGYIHELADWPNLTWDDARLSALLADVRHRQGRLLGRMEGLGFRLRSEAQLSTLTADVVKSSAIEGEKLDAEEVRSSIARRLGLEYAGAAVPSRNVEGIVEMMLDATQRYIQPLTTERLFGWHAALFPTGRSGMHLITVGAWRPIEAGAMQVVSGPIGRGNVHFEAPPAERLEQEMTAFLAWFESQDRVDPVVKAGVAHFWFVTIHPFEDGNGRIGRAIADLGLARADGTAERFYSMSSQIEADRKDYYLQLERGQRNGLDVTLWLEWFLGCLGRAIAKADETLSGVLHKARVWEKLNHQPVSDRQRKIINKLLDGFEGKLTSSKYAMLVKCSEDTALRDIRVLVERGVLLKNEAGGRSTSYTLAEQGA